MKIWELDFTEGKQYIDNNGNQWISCGDSLEDESGCVIEYYFMLIELLKLDFEEIVDWSKIPVDTKVLVKSNNLGKWCKRYFAKYESGEVYCWNNGRTSFSKLNENDVVSWQYAKLYKENKSTEDK